MATESDVREALRQVLDPEVGINIVDLGLIYRIEVDETHTRIVMTMTSPACPLADYLKDLVTTELHERLPAITDVEIVVEWEPPWEAAMMSDEARRQLGEGER